jgi:hypothetical protein
MFFFAQRALLQPGVTHSYSFTVPSPLKQNVLVDILSYPREVQVSTREYTKKIAFFK